MCGVIAALKYFFLSLSEGIKVLTVASTSFPSRKELYVLFCFSWQTVTLFIETIQLSSRLLQHIPVSHAILFKDQNDYIQVVGNMNITPV